MTTTPLSLPARSLSDTNTTHRDDHNAIHPALNDITGTVTFVEPTNVAATDTANLQAAFDQGPGVNIFCGYGRFNLNQRIRYHDNTHVYGAGWGDNNGNIGTQFWWGGGSIGQYRAMLESYRYANNDATKDVACRFQNIVFQGSHVTSGNGLIVWGGRFHLEHCAFYGWEGQTAGHGRGAWFASNSLGNQTGSTGVVLSGGENCFIRDCRFEASREGLFIESGGQQYTDGYCHDCEWMTTTQSGNTTGVDVPQFEMQQAGGWNLRALHSNGSPGDFIHMSNGMACTVTDCYVDGWGCKPTAGKEYGGIHVETISSGDGGRDVTIHNNIFRHRTQQSGVAADWPAIWVEPHGSSAYDATCTITGNSDHIRVGANAARQYFLHLNSSGGASRVIYNVTGNTPLFDNGGAVGGANSGPFDDSNVFHTPNDSTNVKIIQAGNSWQLDDAAPTAGFWPRNTIRYNSGVTNGGSPGWYNVANGTPGTWRTLAAIS